MVRNNNAVHSKCDQVSLTFSFAKVLGHNSCTEMSVCQI